MAKRIKPAEIAAVVRSKDAFAPDEGRRLYRYIDGVYRSGGEDFVRSRVWAVLTGWNKPSSWSSHLAKEVVQLLIDSSSRLWAQPPSNILNVKNGLLDIETGKLDPHTPDHLSTVQIPVEYDPSARCQ